MPEYSKIEDKRELSSQEKHRVQGKENTCQENSFKRIFYVVKKSWRCSIGQMLAFLGSVSCGPDEE
jgi:hypothetical protein